MPPDASLLWKCDNDYDTEAKYQKGTILRAGSNQGVCAGQSALWCYNMATGIRDIYAKPDLMRAMLLQKLYDWSNDRGQLCEKVGLKVTGSQKFGTYQAACLHMETHTGTYYITLYGHGVAAHTTDSYFYAFDPNFGCFRYNQAGKLVEMFRRSRAAVGISGSNGMGIFKVQTS